MHSDRTNYSRLIPDDSSPPTMNIKVPRYSSMALQKRWAQDRLNVLIVDDHPEVVDYIGVLLRQSCKVIKAYDGISGLAKAKSENPDLIIVDVAMPGLNGFELLQKIRADASIHAVPVIMLSALSSEDAKIEALIKGADDYLVKPFKPRELLVRIHAHVRMTNVRKEAHRKEAELTRQIGAIQQDMQSLLEHTNDTYLAIGSDFRILAFNASALNLFSIGCTLIQGMPISECSPDLVGTDFELAIREVLRTSAPFNMEYRTVGGQWYELRIYPAIHGISILGADITEKKKTEFLLITAQEHLERRVQERTAELRASNDLLRISERHQQLLYQRLDAMRDEERTALAREVHDQLGQVLSAAKIDIKLLEAGLSNNPNEVSTEMLVNELGSARQTIDRGIQIVRNIAKDLRTPHLDAEGLFEAIRAYARQFEAKTKTTCHVRIEDRLPLPDKDAACTLYRIFQEAMTNILRHARASEVVISLQNRGNHMRMRVVDNGVGISYSPAAGSDSLGHLGMKERAAFLHGHCRIGRIKPSGTIVSVMIPHCRKPDWGRIGKDSMDDRT